MKIVLMGNPVLRRKAKPVRRVTAELVRVASLMEDFMQPNGVGLAAPQIGISDRFFVYDVGEGVHLVVNPQILERRGEAVDEEGCLSIPGIWAPVQRAAGITLSFLDHDGKRHIKSFEDLEARVIQHEYDHLEGRLFVDYVEDPSTIRVQDDSPVAVELVHALEFRGL